MHITEEMTAVLDNATLLFSVEDINKVLDKMAEDITEKLGKKNPVVLCVMIGGLVAVGNLVMRLNFPLEVDYVHATRYQGAMEGGVLDWKVKPTTHLEGRTVLLVDDILDGGVTLAAIVAAIQAIGAQEVYTAVLIDKHEKRVAGGLPHADFVGLRIADHFVFGYGMDYKEYLRNAPGIYKVATE